MVTLASAQSLVKLRAAEKRHKGCLFCSLFCALLSNNDKNTKLTNYHCTDEQADNYSEHPEQPLEGWVKIVSGLQNKKGDGKRLRESIARHCCHYCALSKADTSSEVLFYVCSE